MTLNELLDREQIDKEQVVVMRHRPYEAQLAKVLPWFAAEQPDVFNAYQQVQGPVLEKTLLKLENKGHVASFLAYGAGKAIFVGLYAIKGSKSLTEAQFWQNPANQQMKKYGMTGFVPSPERQTCEWFDLELQPFRSQWKGRLIIDWPGGERSWWRRAENNDLQVQAILEESVFDKAMPEWHDLCLSWDELKAIPQSWKLALAQWRGVYYIRDLEARLGYVGSAGGDENLLGRWKNYADSGHGGNKLLRDRDPEEFQFSILERVSPDMKSSDLVTLENAWKLRLGTRAPHGLNEN